MAPSSLAAPPSSRLDRLSAALMRPTDTAGLIAFRVALGALVCVSALRFLAFGWIEELFALPRFFFKYWGFSWVEVAPLWVMKACFVALAVLGALIAAGLFTRPVLILTALLFAYVNLCDVTNYLNHYYLVFWLLVLAACMPLGRAGSLDARLWPARRLAAFPAWCTYILRFQVGVVYFFAGLAKCNVDWLLHAQPMAIWLHSRTDTPLVGSLFRHEWMAFLMSWCGFLFDTTVPFWMSWRRSRPLAYLVIVFFHTATQMLFPIGMFPSIMVLSALVFFSPSWPRWLLRKLTTRVAPPRPATAPGPSRVPRWALGLALVFCSYQALMPLRHRLYGGNVSWHEQGMRFSWKVMLREKNASVTYRVRSASMERSWEAYAHTYLSPRQLREFGTQPDMIAALARHIAEVFRNQRGVADAEVHADVWVSLNGRPKARLIDPDVDLSRVDTGLAPQSWILPEPTTLPHRYSVAPRPRTDRPSFFGDVR